MKEVETRLSNVQFNQLWEMLMGYPSISSLPEWLPQAPISKALSLQRTHSNPGLWKCSVFHKGNLRETVGWWELGERFVEEVRWPWVISLRLLELKGSRQGTFLPWSIRHINLSGFTCVEVAIQGHLEPEIQVKCAESVSHCGKGSFIRRRSTPFHLQVFKTSWNRGFLFILWHNVLGKMNSILNTTKSNWSGIE